MDDESVSSVLHGLGLTRYEGEVYDSLVELGEANAREIANDCTVPREKIYYVLRRLEKEGMVRLVSRNPIRYVALQPKNTLKKKIDRIKRDIGKIEEAVDYLEDKYSRGRVRIKRKTLNFWEIVSSPEKRLTGIIESCNTQLDIFMTVEESMRAWEELYGLLKKVERRGVEINICSVLRDINLRPLGRLSNVANVNVLRDMPWDYSIYISDEEVGFILSSNLQEGIHFIDSRLAHILMKFMGKMHRSALDLRSLISLMDHEEDILRLSEGIGKEPFFDLMNAGIVDLIVKWTTNGREEEAREVGKTLLSSLGNCIRFDDLNVTEAVDKVAAVASVVDDYNVDVAFNEETGLLTYELNGDNESLTTVSVDRGLTFPPYLWSLLIQEVIRAKGYRESITTVLYNKQVDKWNFQKKYVRAGAASL